MFEAALLVCLAVAPSECVEVTDARGPYSNEVDCMKRVDEMARFTKEMNLFEITIKWRCTNPKGTAT